MKDRKYDAVPQNESNTDDKEDVFRPLTRSSCLSRQRCACLLTVLSTLLLASLTANAFLIYQNLVRQLDVVEDLPSKFGTVS